MTVPLWHRLVRKGCLKAPSSTRRVRLSIERLEERELLATNLTWVGPDDGLWSEQRNWSPQQVPGEGDTLIFDGFTKNTSSNMDIGNGAFAHFAGLVIKLGYTKTITLQSDLYIDVFNMRGGTLAGSKSLKINQSTVLDPKATKFGTSAFDGGTIQVNTSTRGDSDHRVTLQLASFGNNSTPNLKANLTTDTNTDIQWTGSGSVIVGSGKTIDVWGTFLADSNGNMGNSLGATGKWNLIIEQWGRLYQGQGTFTNNNSPDIKPGGKVFKQTSQLPGGNNVFVVDGGMIVESGATVEVQSGTLSVTGDFTQNGGSTIVDAGQTLSVAGNFSLSAGSLELGASFSTASIFTVSGDYNQTGGTLQIDVANGVQHAVASVGGTANLGGDLYLYLIDAPPESGITIMTYTSYTGDFANKYTNMFEIYNYTPNSTSYDITL